MTPTDKQVESKSFGKLLNVMLKRDVAEVSVADLMNTDTAYVFLDARDKFEFDVSHIQDAVFVGFDDFDIERVAQLPKDAKLIVYCSIGYRSEKIAKKLMSAGYTDVHNLFGGIFEWKNKGNAVYVNKQETDDVHVINRVWGVWLKKGKKIYKP